MSIVNRIRNLVGLEHRADGYTNAVVDALLSQAAGSGTAHPTATSAVQTAVRMIADPFSTARVQGGPPGLSGRLLVSLVRSLMVRGNWVALIEVGPAGEITLTPAASWKVSGTASRWLYELEIPTPQGSAIRRRASFEGVLHARINSLPSKPWQGRAPWQCCELDSQALAYISRSLRWDSHMSSGMLMPAPDGATVAQRQGLGSDLSKGAGRFVVSESTFKGWGQGEVARPQRDLTQIRFGPTLLEHNVLFRDKTSTAVMAAYGLSDKLLNGDGAAQLAARRGLFLDVVEPLGALIAEELTGKLATPISISFSSSQYRDHQRISRALKSYVDSGLSLAQALEVVGLSVSGELDFDDDEPILPDRSTVLPRTSPRRQSTNGIEIRPGW